uniref:Uncharacterized protein n=1 Tax=Ditylenchus dipsaci TaxID=166011 RepID=A0A915EE94_9BILA
MPESITERNENVEQIRRLYFGQGSAQRWCKASETRLLLKLIDHKPADLLNHIYEDETDVCFEEVLTQQHLKELKKSRASQAQNSVSKAFPPSYAIRPTAAEIEQKLNENFNLDVINENELVPGSFLKKVDFFLPDLSSMSDVVPPSCSVTPTPREEIILLPPPLPSIQKERATKRRKPIDSPTELLVDNNSRSSRSSTPGSTKRLRH